MTRDEAVAQVQFYLGRRTDLASQIITEMKQAQTLLESKAELPWFLLTEVASATTTANEERVAFPTDFLREYDGDALYVFDASAVDDEDAWVPLPKYDIVYCRANFPGEAETPSAYAMDGKYFRLFPTLTTAVTLKFIYYAKDVVLSSNVENQWLKYAPEILIGMAGGKTAIVADPAKIPVFDKMRAEAELALDVENEARVHAKQRYIMGGED